MRKPKQLLKSKFKKMIVAGSLGWAVFLIGAIADNIFAGTFLSQESLAAVEVVAPFYSFIGFVILLVSYGGSIKFANYMGANEKKRANQLFTTGIIISLLLGIVTSLTMYIFKNQFLGLFLEPNGPIYEEASNYYNWFIYVALIYPIINQLYSFVAQDGDEINCVVSDFVQTITNFVISIILVKTPLGINGLGIGTLASICCSAICSLVHFFSKKNSIKLQFKIRLEDIKDMFKYGSNTYIASLCVAILDIIMNFFICRRFGELYLTSYAIVNLCINFTQLFTTVSGAVFPFVAGANGARNASDIDDALKMGKNTVSIFCIVCSILVCGFCWALPNLYGLVDTSEGLFKTLGMWAALLIGLPFITYGWTYLINGYYTSFGKPKYGIIANLLSEFIFPLILCIPLSYIFGENLFMNFIGFIIGFAITPILTLLIQCIIIKHKENAIFSLPNYGEIQFSYDGELTDQFIIDTRDNIGKKLEELGVDHIVSNRCMIAVEDCLVNVKSHNNKKIEDRLTVGVSDKCIRFINKDNGVVFNLSEETKVDEKLLVLRALTNQKAKYFINGLLLSFNTNTFTIKNLGE